MHNGRRPKSVLSSLIDRPDVPIWTAAIDDGLDDKRSVCQVTETPATVPTANANAENLPLGRELERRL
jgi:hypothetical protein